MNDDDDKSEIFGDEATKDEYYFIMTNALSHSDRDLAANGNKLTLDYKIAQFEHYWKATSSVCQWIKNNRPSALLVSEDICTHCLDIAATLVEGSTPIFSMDHGSLGSHVFNMHPSPEDMNELFFDVISHYKWKELLVLFDTHMVYRNLQPFQNKASEHNWNLQFVDVDTESWEEIVLEGNFRNILIYCGTEEVLINTLMSSIDYGLMETDYHWIIGNPDVYYNSTHIDSLLEIDAYVTSFKMTADTSVAYSTYNLESHGEWKFRQKLVFDTMFALSKAVESYSNEMKGSPHSSIGLTGNTIMPKCAEEEEGWKMPRNPLADHLMKDLQLQGLTGNVAFNEMGKRINYSISIFSGKGGSMDFQRGEWIQNRHQWEKLYNDELDAEVVHLNINSMWTAGDQVSIGSVMISPFMMEIEHDENNEFLEGNARYEGYIPDLMAEMRNVLQTEGIDFDYELNVYNGGYGDEDSNEWASVVVNGEIDVAAGPLIITDKREEVIDFTIPFGESPVQILVKHPSYVYNTRDFSFAFPLGTEVWCANLVALFLVASLLWIINRNSPLEWSNAARKEQVHPINEENFNFKNCIWFLTSSAFLQSYDVSPRSHAGRIGAAVWWLFSLIMLTSYFANLSDYMRVNKQQAFYQTARDLLRQTDIVYGCVEDGSTYAMLENSQTGDLHSMFEYMFTSIEHPYVSDVGSGVERVRESNGKYAFIADTALMLNAITDEPCNVYLIPQAIGTSRYGLAVQSGSPLRDQLSYAIRLLRERNVLEELKAKWLQPKSECDDKFIIWNNQGLYSLTIVDLKGVYYILFIGIAFSLLFFFLELMCYMLLHYPRHFSIIPSRERQPFNGRGHSVGNGRSNETNVYEQTEATTTKLKEWL
ncbi:glutamate receptor 4-like [Antedon mediterranea]|uniref:glutamate receptor 4-like n=1 Tax=Antedon mediterranea TaxID=105859 RepID=UPI003AF663D7